jgi:hypothetical protein
VAHVVGHHSSGCRGACRHHDGLAGAFKAALIARRSAIEEAINADFGNRSRHETAMVELGGVVQGIDYLERNLRRFMTSGEDRAARNFGLDKLHEHDERYVRASEYLGLVSRLWESWEPDAIRAPGSASRCRPAW